MTITRLRVMTVAVIVSMIFSSIAIAEPGEKEKGKRGDRDKTKQRQGFQKSMQARLGLTDEQAQQLKELREGSKGQMSTASKSVREKQKALDELVGSGAGEAAIRAAATELGKAFGDRAVLQAAQTAGMKKILTPEQFEKMKQFGEERRTRGRTTSRSSRPFRKDRD